MSMIHSSWTPVGLRSSLSFGTARLRTVRSMTVIMHGNARTTRPSQVRAEARWVLIPGRRTGRVEIDTAGLPMRRRLGAAGGSSGGVEDHHGVEARSGCPITPSGRDDW